MKIISKRLLYSTFFILFFIIAPMIIMYSAGYRYNFKKGKVEKTGIIFIESKPKEVSVFVNDKLIKDLTPLKIKNLLPDEYNVRIEKEGYYSWQKKLTVKSNLTTFAKNIILFKKSMPILKISGEIDWFQKVKGQNKFIYTINQDSDKQIKIYEYKTNENKLIYEIKPDPNSIILTNLDEEEKSPPAVTCKPIDWSNNKKKLLVAVNNGDLTEYIIINSESYDVESLNKITNLIFENIKWDLNNNNLIYGLREKILYQIDLSNGVIKPVISNYIIDFQTDNQNIYYTYQSMNESYLAKQEIFSEVSNIIKLPKSVQYFFQKAESGLITIWEPKNNDFYILEKEIFNSRNNIDNFLKFQTKAKSIVWSDDLSKVILYNNYEIQVYNLLEEKDYLINRFSKEIKKAYFLNNNYIVYQLDDTLYLTEDYNGQKNNFELTKLSHINDFYVGESKKYIYLIGEAGNQQGIFELEIR